MKKEPGYSQTNPDNESKKANNIYENQFAQPFLPKSFEISRQTNAEKGEGKEEFAEGIKIGGRFFELFNFLGEAKPQSDEQRKGDKISNYEFWKSIPDFLKGNFFARLAINPIDPNTSKNETPNTYE